MPTYEYQCRDCGVKFTKTHGVFEKEPTCIRCEGEVKRLISRCSFKLNGGNWAKDGYSGKKTAKEDKE